MSYAAVEAAAQRAGLLIMGTLFPHQAGASSEDAGTLILLGTGEEFWPEFTRSPEYRDNDPDPVDRWSKRVIGHIAANLGATCSFPSDGPPYPPFIEWSLGTGRFFESPVGMMVHDTVGLMISLRGALKFSEEFPCPAPNLTSPCIECQAPCASACPVGALSRGSSYDVDACHAFLDNPAGHACMSQGCTARRACPVSRGAGRNPEQSALHMRAFHRP